MTTESNADPDQVIREDVLDYTPSPKAVALARRRAARLAADWGYPHMAGDVALVVSELATNALLHGGLGNRLFRVRLALTERVFRVEVGDPCGGRLPEVREAAGGDTHGRGLVIVAVVGARWGTRVGSDGGKEVWSELDLPVIAERCGGRP
jgi:anti-sigma regulatory factor (Ser/Thr protein kinase)